MSHSVNLAGSSPFSASYTRISTLPNKEDGKGVKGEEKALDKAVGGHRAAAAFGIYRTCSRCRLQFQNVMLHDHMPGNSLRFSISFRMGAGQKTGAGVLDQPT
eukprot:1354103-Amorphochlora_amoeboformis.AAC.1